MKALLIKDFKLLRQQFLIYFIIISVIACETFIDNYLYTGINFIFFNIAFLSIIMAIITMNSINLDATTNSYPFLFSLPIDKKTYIIEKYVFGEILGIIMMIIIMFMSSIIHITNIFGDVMISIYLLCFPLMLIIQAFIIPVQLLFDNQKGKNMIIFILALLFSVIYVGSLYFLSYIYVYFFNLETFIKLIFSISIESVTFILTMISIIILFISMKISITIFSRKEF